MAKRLCDPTSGKIGNQVYQTGRYGQVVRTRAIPTNPRSGMQTTVRANLATCARAWDQLTDAGMAAWTSAALAVQSKSRLGMSGILTGLQLFVKINASLLELGEAMVTVPPALPTFGALPIDGLVIENNAGVVSLKLHTTGAPPEHTQLYGAAPVKAGVGRCPDVVCLGDLDSPVANYITITTAYAARFGAPVAGQRVFVKVNQTENGWQDLPTTFDAKVPPAA